MGRGHHHARKPFTELNIANACNQSDASTAENGRLHSKCNLQARICFRIYIFYIMDVLCNVLLSTTYFRNEPMKYDRQLYHCKSARN